MLELVTLQHIINEDPDRELSQREADILYIARSSAINSSNDEYRVTYRNVMQALVDELRLIKAHAVREIADEVRRKGDASLFYAAILTMLLNDRGMMFIPHVCPSCGQDHPRGVPARYTCKTCGNEF